MIKFESEKAFEGMLFEHIRESMLDPIHGDDVIYGVVQPDFGKSGIGDILLVTERPSFKGDKTIRTVHLIELKTQPLVSSHIAQICKYKTFIECSGLCSAIAAECCIYTVINPYSDISADVFHLADSCGVEIRHYKMTIGGIKFSEYKSFDIDESYEESANKLAKKINEGIK